MDNLSDSENDSDKEVLLLFGRSHSMNQSVPLLLLRVRVSER